MAGERWFDAAELVGVLEKYRPLGRSGDVYARLRRAGTSRANQRPSGP